ncbi:Rpn family recombination-promoting nuclease/putative transposase [Beggiatoa leptomitoformis]|uniref:Rpn family recombination-promoting nuclease/putative transposase n=1 Tax=Beggiatoa leptomitoformis TaxID=288004 RepID=A0A2N9YDN4_9GAMM|nr:Rpn family recombination-promoting nuclease/putative transposase [Beggiatoa leptomitoformis]ALG69006.1 Rpn family recombination-promoting nuclease/putative transposase [Beggiatoa leptomitoformis]AUI68597.1 Rpn family recombination-promoting nuclease/putative transposase [Beggiatoa leptomitoformis]
MRVKDKYINPFTDFGFKKLFGSEPNKDLLIDFLNELLKKETGRILDLTYLPPEQLGRHNDARKAIFDIYCENEHGEKFIVELQKAKQNYFKDRSIYYSTFPIQQQAEKGEWSFKLNAIYTIGILDFVFDEDKEDHDVFHHEVQLIDKSTQKVFYDKLTYIYLEMPKFKKKEDELETHFDKWLYIIRNLENLTNRPPKLQEKVFSKLFEQAEIANYTEQEYADYEESLKVYRDLKNVIDTAFEEGVAEGIEKGKVAGLAEGIEKGKAEGLAEGIEKGKAETIRLTALQLKQAGVAIDVIAKVMGLTVDELDNLP